MSLNDLPEPVRDFLRLDSYRPEDILHCPTFFFRFKKNSDVQDIAKAALVQRVMPYYEKRSIEANTGPYNFLVEPLKNANFHSDSDNLIIRFDLFLTPLVLGASYNDGGSYFTRPEIKEAWENRIEFPEKHKVTAEVNSQGIGFGAGTGMIYSIADFIHVDTSSGILYTGWMAKNFCS